LFPHPESFVNDHIRTLVKQITSLEDELRTALERQETQALYRIEGTKIKFEEKIRELHRKVKMGLWAWLRATRPLNVVSAPFIYSMIVPFLLLDLWLTMYHAICFPLYSIPKVKRSSYIAIDRQHLAYLNVFEKINCMYCGYANGLIAYTREISSRTEQYWCPIKHARKLLGAHPRCQKFLAYGDSQDYQAQLEQFRAELAKEK
jgi:hypothetical protein